MSKDDLWGRLVPAFLCLWLASTVIPSLSLLPRWSVNIWPIDYRFQICCFQGTRAALQSLPAAPILSLETKMRSGERGKVKCLTRSLFLRIEIHNQLHNTSTNSRLTIPHICLSNIPFRPIPGLSKILSRKSWGWKSLILLGPGHDNKSKHSTRDKSFSRFVITVLLWTSWQNDS